MDKENVVHVITGILFSFGDNMDEPEEYGASKINKMQKDKKYMISLIGRI
jgi:hypothetical protein